MSGVPIVTSFYGALIVTSFYSALTGILRSLPIINLKVM